jgi:ankyrin repeat protein
MAMFYQNEDKKTTEDGVSSSPPNVDMDFLFLNVLPRLRDERGNTVLIWAVSRKECLEKLEYFIDSGVDLNAQNFEGQTALFLASSLGLEQTVEFLLSNGANANLATLEETTPLMAAASMGYKRIVRLLIAFGAHVNAQDEEGDTALHMAIREQHEGVVRILVNAGADVRLCNDDGEDAFALACCLQDSEMMDCLAMAPSRSSLFGSMSMSYGSSPSSPSLPSSMTYAFESMCL